MVLDPKFTAAVSSSIISQTVENTLFSLNNKNLTFTLCDRTSVSDNKGNYFISLNLPYQQSEFSTGCSMSLLYPELQQLNVDQIIISPIPAGSFNESIMGQTIKFSVPQNGGVSQTTMSAITLVSSTYSSDVALQHETNALLGDNVVFLFADKINTPYTGSTYDELGNVLSEAGQNTWEPNINNTLLRPAAVSYADTKGNLLLAGVSTDLRTNGHYSVNVGTTYPDNRSGYNYDVPVGFAIVDKGIVVITHTGITQNFPWTSGFTHGTNAAYTGVDIASKTNIYFTGITAAGGASTDFTVGNSAAILEYEDITTSFLNTCVCIGMPRSFYISNNASWDRTLALSTINNSVGIVNLDPVYVSEIGLYNGLGEEIAVAKLSQPVEKNYINVITFYLDIEM